MRYCIEFHLGNQLIGFSFQNPPNFLIQSELRSYVTPVVVLPQEDPIDSESTVDSLIDTSDTTSFAGDSFDSAGNGTISPESRHER